MNARRRSSSSGTSRSRAATLAAVALLSTAAFALLTRAVSRRVTESADAELLDGAFGDADDEVREAAEAIAPAGKWYVYVPAAAALGAVTLAAGRSDLSRRGAGAAAIVLPAVTSALINPAFDRWLPQPAAVPPGRREKPKPAFPSGHTFGLGSVTLAASYVLTREGLAPVWLVAPLALLVPAVSAAARMAEEKHWPSDVAGGALVAVSIASVWLAAYELA